MKKIRLVAMILMFLLVTTCVTMAADRIVDGDKILFFRDMTIPQDVEMDGDIVAIFSDIRVDGIVDGDIVSIFGKVDIFGTVDGSVVSVLGNIDMNEESVVTRDLIQIAVGEEDRPDGAIIRGEEISIRLFRTDISGISALIVFLVVIFILKNIFGFILSVILVASVPERMEKIAEATSNRIGRRLGLGILGIVIFYAANTVLVAVIIGAPLIPILFIIKWLWGLGGNTAVKLAIGRRIGRKGNWSNITQLIVGSLIYMVIDITLILEPFLYLAKLVGMGAIIDTQIGTTDYWNMNRNNKMKDSPAYKVVDDDFIDVENEEESVSNATDDNIKKSDDSDKKDYEM